MRKKTMACKTPRHRSNSDVARRSNSVDQVAALGDSSPNRSEDDDKSKQSDRGSPEVFIAAVGDSSPNRCEDDNKSKKSNGGSPKIFIAAVGDSSPNRCEDDDKSKKSDRGSPEIFIAAVGDSSPNRCEDDDKSKKSDRGSPEIFIAAVGDSSPNRCKDDDKRKKSDRGSPEIFVAAVGDSSPNRCEDDDKSNQADRGSPDIFSQERTVSDRLEKHRCIKCDKVGKMLVCTENECPVAIHQECLNPKPHFDDSGNFYCPYCAYKRAIDKTQRLKKKVMSAKEQLAKFLKVAVADSVGGQEHENEKKEKAATAPPQSEDRNQHADEIQPNQHVDENMADEETHDQVRDLEETAVRKEHKKIASPEKTEKAAGESLKGGAFECNAGENVEHESRESHNESVSEGSVEQNDNAPKSTTLLRKNPSHEKKVVNVFPLQGKRKRTNWTPEEEEMLKDGVQIFTDPKKKNLPWRKILQFGSHVFHESRLPVDLQCKWKNMTRKN